MKSDINLQLFEEVMVAAESFTGRTCIGFIEGDGSYIKIEFEPRRSRLRLLSNPSLTDEQRSGEAEYSIFIQCAWRLDSSAGVVCGGWDDDSPDGPKGAGLQGIVGQRVKSLHFVKPGLDLEIRFENDLVIRVFSDQVNEYDNNDNYSLAGPKELFVIGTKSRLRRERK